MPPMDTERIPTEPTTDHVPPSVTSLTPGPSQAPTSPAAGPRRRTGVIAAVVGLALVATFSAGIGVGSLLVAAAGGPTATTPDPASPGSTDLGVIQEAWDTIHREYVGRDELDDQQLVWGAIDGLTQAVGDTGHTDFMTPEEREQRRQSLSGSYVGIGVRIDPTEAGLPRIVGVFEGSPAEGAGLLVGDVIIAVDGTPTAGKTIDEVATLVRGEAGTTVSVTVQAEGTGPERTLDIVRADVPIDPVSWTMVPGTTTALIRLDQFSNGAADEIVQTLKDARTAGAERIVLDLRGNPGGYVNEAIGVASQFVGDGIVYQSIDATGVSKDAPVTPGGAWTSGPLVVLADGSSASSAEIVTGAIQDAGRGTVVGEKTFGTGTVLGRFDLADRSSMRIGVERWLTRGGRPIWHEGLEPDVKVVLADDATPLRPDDLRSLTAAELAKATDTQVLKALEVLKAEA
jgi:carboxyl-terminal processing protease